MSEPKMGNKSDYLEQLERIRARRIELEPKLAYFALKAKNAYEVLRPLAKHVSTVERDYPLRHQQVHALGVGGVGAAIADYLMISFGNNHDLTLYHNGNDGRPFRWQFERSIQRDRLLSEQTKIEELRLSRSSAQGGGVMSIDVATYRYAEEYGTNGQFANGLCDYGNLYKYAEKYTSSFQADIDFAVQHFSN